ncbi:hypothetical protein C0J52_18251 [Blattella germanica]|nr:hypothetical protein C0J52_18251 [Blattella germanica]
MVEDFCKAVLLFATVGAAITVAGSQPTMNKVQVGQSSTLHRHRYPRQINPNPNREAVINNIFQIPISTLSAVSSLLQSTRPLSQRPFVQQQLQHFQHLQQNQHQQQLQLQQQLQQQVQQQLQQQLLQNRPEVPVYYGYNGYNKVPKGSRGPPTRGAKVAQVSTAADGSSFKI